MRPSKDTIERIFSEDRNLISAPELQERLLSRDPGPLSCDFTLSDACQHKCPFCVDERNEKKGPIMKPELAVKLIDELGRMGVRSINFEGGGEPLVGPFDVAIEAAHRNEMAIGLITNGGLLHQKKHIELILKYCSYVRISVDSWDKESHSRRHGTDEFIQVATNVATLVEERDKLQGSNTPVIGVGYLYDEETIPHALEAYRLFSDWNVDYVAYRPMHDGKRFYDIKRGKERDMMRATQMISVTSDTSPYASITWWDEDDDFDPGKKCFAHRGKITVGADGRVYTCCNKRYQDAYSFGQATFDVSIQDLWRGEKRDRVISRLENPMQDMKRHCNSCNSENLNKGFTSLSRPSLHARFLG